MVTEELVSGFAGVICPGMGKCFFKGKRRAAWKSVKQVRYAFFSGIIMIHKSELQGLRKEFARNKRIPKKYEYPILQALSHYPELRQTCISFDLAKKAKMPYGCKPSIASLFRKQGNREYHITVLEEAEEPMQSALMKHLPIEEQIGAFAHELSHVVQYEHKTRGELLRMVLLRFPVKQHRREIERAADIAVIHHGLGRALYRHAVFIREIPGYVEERKNLNEDYLLPREIMLLMKKRNPLRYSSRKKAVRKKSRPENHHPQNK